MGALMGDDGRWVRRRIGWACEILGREAISSGNSTSRNTLLWTHMVKKKNQFQYCQYSDQLTQRHLNIQLWFLVKVKDSPLLLVFLFCGDRDFLKLRPVRLGTKVSALALDAVLSAPAGGAVVDFIPPSVAGSFKQSSNAKSGEKMD